MRARPHNSPARWRGTVAAVVAYGALASSQLVLDACTNVVNAIPPTGIIGPGTTSMSVDPSSFLGALVCSDQVGSVKSYVATVTEVLHPCSDDSGCRSGLCALGVCVDDTTSCAGVDDTTSCTPGACVGSYCDNKPATPCSTLSDCECTALDPAGCKPGLCHPPVCGETFTLPSSPPTSCAQSAYFEYITVGSSYVAEVDAYTEPAKDLVSVCGEVGAKTSMNCLTDADCPAAYGCAGRCLYLVYENAVPASQACLDNCTAEQQQFNYTAQWLSDCQTNCGLATDFDKPLTPCAASPPPTGGVWSCQCNYLATEGDRHMYSRLTQQPVTAAWSTPSPCGQGPSPPVAQAFVNVAIAPCPNLDGGTDASTGTGTVTVYPSAALPSGLYCVGGVPAGPVAGFDVVPTDGTLPAKTGTPCPSSAQDAEYTGLVPGRCYAFRVTAHIEASDAGPATTLSSWCVATPVGGVTVSAMCDPLVPADPDAGTDGGADAGSPCP